MSTPRISVCLPTWNGERDLARLLPALARQIVPGGMEIVAIDSSSSDATRALLERAGARVVTIAQRDFGHGRTRNALAAMARGELLVFLSQDATPRDADTLATLASALDDPRTAGACARLVPHADDDPLTLRTALEAPEASAAPLVVEPCDVSKLGARERSAAARFHDSASCLRAEILRALPFPDVAFGEDSAWAARALGAGWRVRFESRAVFEHAHSYTLGAAYARYRIDAVFQRETYDLCVRPSAFSAGKGLIHEVAADVRFVARRGRGWLHLARSPFLRGAQVLGAWSGSRG